MILYIIWNISRNLGFEIFNISKFLINTHTTYPDISDTIYPASILNTMQMDEQPSEASVFGEALFNGTINQSINQSGQRTNFDKQIWCTQCDKYDLGETCACNASSNKALI